MTVKTSETLGNVAREMVSTYIGVIIKPVLSFENFERIQYLITSKWFLQYENPKRQANDQEHHNALPKYPFEIDFTLETVFFSKNPRTKLLSGEKSVSLSTVALMLRRLRSTDCTAVCGWSRIAWIFPTYYYCLMYTMFCINGTLTRRDKSQQQQQPEIYGQ